MTTLADIERTPGACFVYSGDREDWPIVATMHRDSHCLDQSNFRVMLQLLGGESDTVAVECMDHWAVGWLEHILIDPSDQNAQQTASDAQRRLEGYPVLDETDFSALEYETHRSIVRRTTKRDGCFYATLDCGHVTDHGTRPRIGSDLFCQRCAEHC